MHAAAPINSRQKLSQARRIVIKIGSRILIEANGRPARRRIGALVKDIAALRRAGHEVILVTSGAIGTGMHTMGLRRRPTRLPELQMAAAIGQSRLMTLYDRLFAKEHCLVGQVLLTHADLKHRTRHLNARATMRAMLQRGLIPIINENDVVAVDEIKFGDNDLLAALVVHLLNADLLILLTSTDGLRRAMRAGRTQRLALVPEITKDILKLARDKADELSTGGMFSKLEAAAAATKAGTAVVIADGRRSAILRQIMTGIDTGTLILPEPLLPQRALDARARWIAFFQKPQGTLWVDDGARRALELQGKSLLPIGIKKTEGNFAAGAAVDIKALDGTLIARGLVAYASGDIHLIQGHRSKEICQLLTTPGAAEVIHRDNLALLRQPTASG